MHSIIFTMHSIISLQSNITRRKANITEAHFLTECASRSTLFLLFLSHFLRLIITPRAIESAAAAMT